MKTRCSSMLGCALEGDTGLHAGDRSGGQRRFPAAAGRAGAGGWGVRAGRVGRSARRGDGRDPPTDRHAGRDRRVSRAGGVRARGLADTLVPDRPPSLFAGSPLLLLGRYRGRPHGPVEVAWQDAGPASCGVRRSFPASVTIRRSPRPGRAGRSASSRTATPPGGRSFGARANDHRDVAPVRRLVPVHGLCGRRPCGRCQRGGRGAPDHAAGRDAGGVGSERRADVCAAPRARLPMQELAVGRSLQHPECLCHPVLRWLPASNPGLSTVASDRHRRLWRSVLTCKPRSRPASTSLADSRRSIEESGNHAPREDRRGRTWSVLQRSRPGGRRS